MCVCVHYYQHKKLNVTNVQVDLDHSCHERDSLHEQLQFQRETAAASLNRMQKHNQEKCNDLHKKIQEQAGKLNEVHTLCYMSIGGYIHTISMCSSHVHAHIALYSCV